MTISKTLPAIALLAALSAPAGAQDTTSRMSIAPPPRPGAGAPAQPTNNGATNNPAQKPQQPAAAGYNAQVPAPMQAAGQPSNAPPDKMMADTSLQIDQQAGGNYGSMVRSSGLPLGVIQHAWDDPTPAPGQDQQGSVRFPWTPGMVMKLRMRIGTTTDIIIPEWDTIAGKLTGDEQSFELVVESPTVITVRPVEYGIDTSISIYGASGNVYKFYVRAEGRNSQIVPDLLAYVDAPAVRHTYNSMQPGADHGYLGTPLDKFSRDIRQAAGQAPNSRKPTGIPDYITALQIKPSDMHFDYDIQAKNKDQTMFIPEHVFTDGHWTYFDFGKRGEFGPRPVVLAVIDGVETNVNTHLEGDHGQLIAAEAANIDFVLRSNQQIVCVHYTGPALGYDTTASIPLPDMAPSQAEYEHGTLVHNDPPPDTSADQSLWANIKNFFDGNKSQPGAPAPTNNPYQR